MINDIIQDQLPKETSSLSEKIAKIVRNQNHFHEKYIIRYQNDSHFLKFKFNHFRFDKKVYERENIKDKRISQIELYIQILYIKIKNVLFLLAEE